MKENFEITKEDLNELFNIQKTCSERLELLKLYGKSNKLLDILKTDAKKGLSCTNFDDLNARVNQFGSNKFPKSLSKSFLDLFLIALNDKLILTLILCAFISIVLTLFFPNQECHCSLDKKLGINQLQYYFYYKILFQ
jgi:magnesium-transporting ATPase (P-type)